MGRVIKTCPHCGGEAKISSVPRCEDAERGHVFVMCEGCGTATASCCYRLDKPADSAEGFSFAVENVIGVWNDRDYSLIKAEVEHLCEKLLNGLCVLSTDYAMEEDFYQDMVCCVREISHLAGSDLFDNPQ